MYVCLPWAPIFFLFSSRKERKQKSSVFMVCVLMQLDYDDVCSLYFATRYHTNLGGRYCRSSTTWRGWELDCLYSNEELSHVFPFFYNISIDNWIRTCLRTIETIIIYTYSDVITHSYNMNLQPTCTHLQEEPLQKMHCHHIHQPSPEPYGYSDLNHLWV